MTVEDAVMQMNLLGNEFLVFTDADTAAASSSSTGARTATTA